MRLYEKGDRVLIVSKRTIEFNSEGKMDKYLGTVMTIDDTNGIGYRMKEDHRKWRWFPEMIVGIAPIINPEQRDKLNDILGIT